MSTDTQAKDLPIETNFSASFTPTVVVGDSQVLLDINGVFGATVIGRGFTRSTELKGKIHIQSNIAEVPNSYLIATAGSTIVFLFRARGPTGPIIGAATFSNPFIDDFDWNGNLDWGPLVPIPPKVNGIELVVPSAPPTELWQHAPITIRVETGAVSRLIVASAAGHKGVLEIDADMSANPPFPVFLFGTLWYKPEMFNLEINAWQLIVKKPGGYYLTFAPEMGETASFLHNTPALAYAHLDTIIPTVPVPGDWYGNVIWVLDSQPLRPRESKHPITLSNRGSGPVITVVNQVINTPELSTFFDRIMQTGDGIDVDGWIHIDNPSLLFGKGTWDMQVHQSRVPPGETIFAVLTFYFHDTRRIVGQATFNGIGDRTFNENPPTEWCGEYDWRSTDLTIDPPKDTPATINPPKNLPLTAEITLVLPSVTISFRRITANFGGWSAVLPDDFAKFFIYTPYEFLNFGSPKVVPGTLLYEPSLVGVKNRWKVETVYGDSQAVMTLHSSLIGPILPIGFAIFNGKFPAGTWEGVLEWKKPDDELVEAA